MRFDLLYESSLSTPLGAVRLIGEVAGGRGVEPKDAMRTIETYGLTFILEGTGSYQGPGHHRYEIMAGSLILTYPNRPHLFGPAKGHTWHEIFAIFEGPLFDLLVERQLLHPDRLVLQLDDPQPFANQLRLIASSTSQVEVQTRLAGWLIDAVTTATPNPGKSLASDWLSRATHLLESNLDENRSMESIADSLEIGYETFRKEFAKHTGVSPMKFRIRRRLGLAAGLLNHTGLPVAEIAQRLGYPDAFTFSKAFKRQYGVSPSEFRRAV